MQMQSRGFACKFLNIWTEHKAVIENMPSLVRLLRPVLVCYWQKHYGTAAGGDFWNEWNWFSCLAKRFAKLQKSRISSEGEKTECPETAWIIATELYQELQVQKLSSRVWHRWQKHKSVKSLTPMWLNTDTAFPSSAATTTIFHILLASKLLMGKKI